MDKPIELGFLQNVKLDVVKTLSPAKKPAASKIPPDSTAIRVFANGQIYPSKAFAEDNNLEYVAREPLDNSFIIKNNGLDVFSSEGWQQIQGKLPEGVKLIFGCVSPKALAKVDLWSSTKYEDDNTPKASVYTQGAQTYGKKTLLPMLTEIYQVNWENTEYVDLICGQPLPATPDAVYHLPKIIASGPKKGESTYVRRSGVEIFPITIASIKEVAGKQTNIIEQIADADSKDKPIDFEGQLGDMDVKDAQVIAAGSDKSK